jgi:hypothetical protein
VLHLRSPPSSVHAFAQLLAASGLGRAACGCLPAGKTRRDAGKRGSGTRATRNGSGNRA